MSALQLNILDELQNLVIVLNNNSQVEYVSPSSRHLLGFEPDELLGEGWWKLTKASAEIATTIKAELNNLVVSEFEREIITSAGDTKWILWKMSELQNSKLIGIGYDITQRKLLELQIEEQTRLLAERNKELLDSIEYASNIQYSLLPEIEDTLNVFGDAFLLYKPKDLISGDFYWQYVKDDVVITAVIDCTGHGVPGALVTIMANAAFNDIVQKRKVFDPAIILSELDSYITTTLNERSSTTRLEGMDVSITVFDKTSGLMKYAGAYRPLFLVRNNELTIIDGNKNPIGFYFDQEKRFDTIEIPTEKGDTFYMFTDGYTDQFGGQNVKKFNRKRFISLLLSIQEFSLKKQLKELEVNFESWKGKNEQIDDVTVVGVRI